MQSLFNVDINFLISSIAIPGAVLRHEDKSHSMSRIEITCTACGGHLGHVFKGEHYPTPSTFYSPSSAHVTNLEIVGLADERHCVNSVSLKFVEDEKQQASA